ncbi:Serine hydroxymethyltransferase [Mycoplasmopsis meleagridis]|uniref:Serine hydroxymethyltransferase n=1 Tax=Mycoplasmopsis meleagridis ATCC 25294 TaxID=1264554 RepID=A0A0F5H1A4_9BACT|nr:serine hydroxymethyltransferase [Mycoplasmopsis meleagridis]KKB26637.1 Serine hydroxymethyltransferase [Mycoplasmopsis meleagridis ATCC 25294]OAD18248.1 Serine hydroxymethyltransferase [Mycoplasmopsis meleagridis]VEU77691.1 Serine hydroxymethyltransferase [Mycoplasmopsis meleagridis]
MFSLKDKVIEKAIRDEQKRQQSHIELIASENYVSVDVLKAVGSILTNKYAEGYPSKRYYDGCEFVDIIEETAKERLKKLFNVKYVNVQPYSGSTANAAALATICEPGDKIMGLSLSSGGHLTHGYKITFSGTYFHAIAYETDENGYLDYEKIKEIALKERPKLIITGYSAYSRMIDFKKFREIADECGAKLMADIAHIAGLIAAGAHPTPVPYADIITSTTHKTLRGARGAVIMTNDEEIAKKMNRWVFPGFQGGPLVHQIAGKAVAFNEALKPSFKIYAHNVVKNSKTFAQAFKNNGATIVAGGTDNHLFTINVYKTYNLTGKEASSLLAEFNITVNKNTVPHDTLSPMIASGIRLGTPAMTSRNFDKWVELANIIHKILSTGYKILENKEEVKKIKKQIAKWMKKYPILKYY